jgi:hypothetical protein
MSVQMCNQTDIVITEITYDDNDWLRTKAELTSVVVSMAKYPETLIALLKTLDSISDEVVLILDNGTPDIMEKFKNYATTIVALPGKGSLEAYSKDILNYCTKEWILRVDDDETLSREFTRDVIQYYISDRYVTSYWIPRRWYVNETEFLINKPWYPDYQLRLFRNLPAIITLPSKIHEPLKVLGNAANINEIHLNHFDLTIASREEREQKVARYEALNPGQSNKMYYLYEDYLYDTANNIDSTKKSDINSISAHTPYRMLADTTYGIDVTIHTDYNCTKLINMNNSDVYASYHWFNKDMSVYQWDNERTGIYPKYSKTEHAEFTSILIVKTPQKPGIYYLQADIVEEGKRWFANSGLITGEMLKIEVLSVY